MKEILVAGAITSSLLVSMNANAASDSVPVNITATVVENTCTPSWELSGMNVDFSRVSVKDFGVGKAAGQKSFSLSLKDCGANATKVSVTASGSPDGTDSKLFANSVSTTSGVGVAIWGGPSQSTQMTPDGQVSVEYPITDNASTMTFSARLMQSGSTAPVAGDVKSTITMTVTYI